VTGDVVGSDWQRFWERGGFWRAVLLTVLYSALYLGASALVGVVAGDLVDPDDPFADATSVLVGLAVPIALGVVLLVAFGASVRWLGEAFGPQPVRGAGWMWVLPVAVLAFNGLRFAAADYAAYAATTVVMILVAGLCVGAAEELLCRGYVVLLLRRHGYGERAVAVLSALLFALLHSTNLLGGQTLATVGLTVVYAFFFGIAMYLTLRVTGRLIWPVLLHASTDASLFLLVGGIDTAAATGATATLGSTSTLATVAGLANVVVIGLGLVLVWFIRGRVPARAEPVDA